MTNEKKCVLCFFSMESINKIEIQKKKRTKT